MSKQDIPSSRHAMGLFSGGANKQEFSSGRNLIFAEQEVIDAFELTGRRVMREVLEISWDEIMVSDLSDLGDFCSSGIPKGSIPKNATWHQTCRIWDAWVIAKISDLYSVHITKTNIRLVELFRQVEKALENPMIN